MNESYLESLLITEEDWIATERFSFFHRKKQPVSRPKETPEEEKEREQVLSKLSQRIRTVSRKLLIRLKNPLGYSLCDEDDTLWDEGHDGTWWFNAIDYDVWPIAKKLNVNARDLPGLSEEDPKWKTAGTIALYKMLDLFETAIREDAILKRLNLSVDYGGDWDDGPIGVYYRYKKEEHHE